MRTLNNRNQIPGLLTELGLTGLGAEIGVAEAYYGHHVLDSWPGSLYLIDCWRILDTPGFTGHGEATDADQEARYQRVLRTSQRFGKRCTIIRATSEDAAKRIPGGILDFAYVDATHTKEAAAEDIKLWFPKVRSGGLLCGHDYLSGIYGGQQIGVKDAVDEFAAARQLKVYSTAEKDWPSFIIQV